MTRLSGDWTGSSFATRFAGQVGNSCRSRNGPTHYAGANTRRQGNGKLHDTNKAEANVTACEGNVTRHRRVGRGEEVDDNGNAAPIFATKADGDVKVGADQVR
jgi:hypothetical protein